MNAHTSITVAGTAMPIIEVHGDRVVTLAMVDKVHGRPDGTARRNFNTNRDRLIEGRDFSKMSADEFRTRFPGRISARATEDVTVLTQTGYLMLVKSFTDDLAWDVQRQLVEIYFAKPKGSADRGSRIDVVRESRMQMLHFMKIAKMIGLTGNQAVLSASRATAEVTGVDPLGLLGATHMDAPQNKALLTPTEIGRRTGIGSARAVNARLCSLGLQYLHRDGNDHIYYEPTDAGLDAGAIMQDTGKRHSDGAPVRQLRWASSVEKSLIDASVQPATLL